MSRVTFGGKHASEIRQEVFDFTSRLAVGETISNAVVTATVYSGTDAAPSALIRGSATISGAQVKQVLMAGVLGVTYLLTCAATTSTLQELRLTAFMTIIPDHL